MANDMASKLRMGLSVYGCVSAVVQMIFACLLPMIFATPSADSTDPTSTAPLPSTITLNLSWQYLSCALLLGGSVGQVASVQLLWAVLAVAHAASALISMWPVPAAALGFWVWDLCSGVGFVVVIAVASHLEYRRRINSGTGIEDKEEEADENTPLVIHLYD